MEQDSLSVVEICAGAGGQALGLEKAGFEHELAVELDANASATLRANRPWKVAEGDVADSTVWNPEDHRGIALLAGGVPCPPFTIAGKQLGATDERDLFAWAVEQVAVVQPRALLLENVRGLSMPRFAGYRQHVLDRLTSLGYMGEWKLLQASDYGVPQLRPRFVLVALKPEDAAYFTWPEPQGPPPTVGEILLPLMKSRGWRGADAWKHKANKIAPTIVGGSKKHGGADLGPTRAKRAWAEMGVDALGVADEPPGQERDDEWIPKLTTEMVSLLQGWRPDEWHFTGRKTTRYRQIGNAFPPPVAEAVGNSIRMALEHEGIPAERAASSHDPIYKALRESGDFLTPTQLQRAVGRPIEPPELERTLSLLSRDFDLDVRESRGSIAYRLGTFKAFVGQDEHSRHEVFQKNRGRIS
ncbi:DNA cytosine methyltransferase [Cryptosporangium phraense]|uniref:DNA (cytosine-5-)-methyltransferase n=1 Tax=Cryptosporangium phraense TaxID=2593070 RepID=A0A545ARF2_9ACTN|nr:DNA (cytosine-5-)-methyltransferase [Cryptosporangium phraense]TQS43882.1 DNA (cytosine-5-)-methyltransferase [Cryptosporangium phraense]